MTICGTLGGEGAEEKTVVTWDWETVATSNVSGGFWKETRFVCNCWDCVGPFRPVKFGGWESS